MIKVSVIIPVYNAERHLEQCVRSVLSQTLRDIEILCVDDGSTDASPGILARLAREDARITVLTQKNAGAGAARNHGLRHARGEYLSFLDADDFFEPRMLEEAYTRAQRDAAQIVIFKADFYNEKRGCFSPCIYSLREDMLPAQRPFAAADVERDLFKTVVGWAWDKLFLASFIRENQLLFQEQRTSNDLFFVFSALARAARITTLPEVLAHQRRHAGQTLSVTREKSWMCFYDALLALRDQLKAWGIYERFACDFVNYALHFSLWNLNTLKGESKKKLYNALRESWFDELGIASYPEAKFYHRGEYAQYRQIMRWKYNGPLLQCAGIAQRGMTYLRRKMKNMR